VVGLRGDETKRLLAVLGQEDDAGGIGQQPAVAGANALGRERVRAEDAGVGRDCRGPIYIDKGIQVALGSAADPHVRFKQRRCRRSSSCGNSPCLPNRSDPLVSSHSREIRNDDRFLERLHLLLPRLQSRV
jgi:hypothetical protein